MDIRQLEYFQRVGKLNNITRAAEQLHVSQSTVTLAIKRLEDEVDMQLFDRSQKNFVLTTEGRVFWDKVSNILVQLQDAVAELHEYRDLQKGTLKLGVPPMVGAFLMPDILAAFKAQYPQLQLTIIEEGSRILRQSLEQNELDLAFVNLHEAPPLLDTLLIAREPLAVCLPPGHALEKQNAISLEQLRDEQFILFKEDAFNRQIILKACEKKGFAPSILLSSGQVETHKELVSKGLGISFLIETIASKSKRIVTRPLAEPIYLEFGLAWRKDKYLSRAAQIFINFVLEKKPTF